MAGLIWGSFLNVVAYRLICEQSLGGRSSCPQCFTVLAWYDLIPCISWILLQGSCRTCKMPISWLYPFIEILTALVFVLLALKIPRFFWLGYGLLSSALIVTIRTDLESLLVSRYASLFLIPVGVIFAYVGLLPITGVQSIFGSLSAYSFLYLIAYIFKWITGKEGMGQGDLELIACVGAFVGFPGWWFALLYAALSGSIMGIMYSYTKRETQSLMKLPFCPFIALGTWFYLFWPEYTAYMIFC